jgi:hypothetical protein
MNTTHNLCKRLTSPWVLMLAMAVMAPASAYAQLSLLFSPPDVSGYTGSPVALQAELINLGSQSVTWDSLSTSADSSLVLSNISSSFEAGTLAGGHILSGVIFDVTPTQAGVFDGTVTLSNGSNAMVSGNFQMTANSQTPPPPTVLFTLAGGVGAILRLRRVGSKLRANAFLCRT